MNIVFVKIIKKISNVILVLNMIEMIKTIKDVTVWQINLAICAAKMIKNKIKKNLCAIVQVEKETLTAV